MTRFLYITQLSVKQMLAQKTGGSNLLRQSTFRVEPTCGGGTYRTGETFSDEAVQGEKNTHGQRQRSKSAPPLEKSGINIDTAVLDDDFLPFES